MSSWDYEVEDGRWLVTFAQLDLGYIELRAREFEPKNDSETQTKAS